MKILLLSTILFLGLSFNVQSQSELDTIDIKMLMKNPEKLTPQLLDSLAKRGLIKSVSPDSMPYIKENKKRIGTKAPDFDKVDINGKKHHIQQYDEQDKIVVLNFWFAGCTPCIREMPELNKLVEQYKNKPVVFISLAPEPADFLKKFTLDHHFDYCLIPEAKDVRTNYKVQAYPTHIIIDKNGIVRSAISGYSETIRSEIGALIDKCLAE